MKKNFYLMLVLSVFFIGCGSTPNVGYVPNRVEKNMFMPDGVKADVFFSQKWSGELGDYANNRSQWQGKSSVLVKAKTEAEYGYGTVWHNEDENESIKAICDIMKESGFKYGVAYVNYGNRIRRNVFTYKKGKIRNSFMDFFDETDEFYIENKW
ncbi:MAG: hypothetical protein K6B17_08830 [Treponema sp.]|nr:hypothetical protein [Treponema sp.]